MSAVLKFACVFSLMCFAGLISAATNDIPSDFDKENVKSFTNCALDGNLTCLEILVKSKIYDLKNRKEVELADGIVIEKLDDVVHDDKYETEDAGRSEGSSDSWDTIINRFFSSRAVKFSLWDLFKFRVSKSPESPENLLVSMALEPEAGMMLAKRMKGGRHMAKVIVPLLIGFILTGKLIFGIAFVKALLMKAFVVSKIALISAAFLLVKKILNHHPYPFLQPQYPFQYGATGYGYATPYSGYATIQPNGQAWANTDYEPAAAAPVSEDLQGHYSNNLAVNATPKMRRKYTSYGVMG